MEKRLIECFKSSNNTLETIRMLAVSDNDKEVADISFWFGKLTRYSQRGRYRTLHCQRTDQVLLRRRGAHGIECELGKGTRLTMIISRSAEMTFMCFER
ncbi:hypothetical protein [Paenibacillus harenae]|uniref:hypothetical protein n=1 Tax=Paenibacillus harenae TaxID=306543 RepID=UPI0027D81ED2|nr:hypothetical protein [Paenibacillus harenae]